MSIDHMYTLNHTVMSAVCDLTGSAVCDLTWSAVCDLTGGAVCDLTGSAVCEMTGYKVNSKELLLLFKALQSLLSLRSLVRKYNGVGKSIVLTLLPPSMPYLPIS